MRFHLQDRYDQDIAWPSMAGTCSGTALLLLLAAPWLLPSTGWRS
jgi:hypothetical protein